MAHITFDLFKSFDKFVATTRNGQPSSTSNVADEMIRKGTGPNRQTSLDLA